MHIPRERSTKEQIESIAHMILASWSGKAIRVEILMKDFLTQIKSDKLLNKDLKAIISNVQCTWRKASRRKSVALLR